jgi:hypothetical protein
MAGLRKGECVVETETGTTPVGYRVKWQDARKRLFEVRIEPFVLADPPSCASTEVMRMVEQMIKDSLAGIKVTGVKNYNQIGFDKESKTRWGVCTVHTPVETFPVNYKVQLVDEKNGSFRVALVH